MKLSKRLLAIADMIDEESIVLDIGCDHALLDIYLTQKYPKIKCIACDINEKALSIAKKNILFYGLNNRIDTKLSDGINDININNQSVIVISGMGAKTIMHILSNDNIKYAKQIILQSNTDLYELRKFIYKKGYIIHDEVSILEKGKYYIVINLKKGKIKYNNLELLLGPMIIKNKNANYDYLDWLLNKEKKVYKNIPIKHFILKIKSYVKIKKIMDVLHKKC